MENLQLKIESLTGNEIIIREGQALPLQLPETIKIDGDIKSISSFLTKRSNGYSLQNVDANKAIVIVDKKELTITLCLDKENKFGTIITGKLETSEELKPFSINKNKTFTKEELVKLLKFSRLFFDDAAKHAEMLLAFQKVSSTVNIRANESSDDRGNKERAYVKDVTTNAPTEFILNIPVFKGFPPQRFRVEICLDVTDGSARFWFESVELYELVQSQVDAIFNDELEYCKDFVIINK